MKNKIMNLDIGEELTILDGIKEFKIINKDKGFVVYKIKEGSLGKKHDISLDKRLQRKILIKNGIDRYEVFPTRQQPKPSTPYESITNVKIKETVICKDHGKVKCPIC